MVMMGSPILLRNLQEWESLIERGEEEEEDRVFHTTSLDSFILIRAFFSKALSNGGNGGRGE